MRALDVPEDLIVALHEARTTKEFGPALFALVNQALPSRALVLFLRPLEFELPALCSRPEFQFVCDEYIAGRHTDDIWLQRSPINPDIPVVRHSDYMPQAMLRESTFYHRSMAPTGCEYGASIVAWKRDTWLATLTVLRTEQQGDIRDRELPMLRACQVHFQSAAIRVAMIREESLGRHSLETFVWSLPTAALVLDWSLKVLHYNAFAQELCHYWRLGAKASRLKGRRNLVVPGDLLAAIGAHKKAAEETKSNRPGSPEVIPLLEISHPQNPDLKAKVSFVPSRSLALSKGTFLVALQHHTPVPDRRQVYDRFTVLTRRERDVVALAVKGLSGPAIARRLGTSPITVRTQLHKSYRKLGISSRHELLVLFSNHDGLFTAGSLGK